MELVRFFATVIKIALVLACLGTLKTCTTQVTGLAAAKTEAGIMSYSRFTKALTK